MIGIVGFGKLGHSLARVLRDHGYGVEGVDTDPARQLAGSLDCFTVTGNHMNIKDAEIIFVVVNTACEDGYRYHNLDAVMEQLQDFSGLVVISSTCEPSFFQQRPALRIVYNPFFIRQGQIEADLSNPDLVLIGDDYNLAWPLMEIWSKVLPTTQGCSCVIETTTLLNAAVTKLAINTYLAMKISYANLVGDLCMRLQADPQRVLELTGQDSRIGTRYLTHGFGYGGPCLPIDVKAMQRALVQNGLHAGLIDAVDSGNREHLLWQVRDFADKHDLHERVVLSEIAYRPGTNILVQSQQLAFASALVDCGYRVCLRSARDTLDRAKAIHGDRFTYEIVSD